MSDEYEMLKTGIVSFSPQEKMFADKLFALFNIKIKILHVSYNTKTAVIVIVLILDEEKTSVEINT